MKILLVNSNHFKGGGDSTYYFNLANLLKKNGHTIAFFSMKDNRNIKDINESYFVENIDYKILLKEKNLKNIFLVIYRSILSLEAYYKFNKILKIFRPDIIHLQNIHAHITPSIIFSAKKKKVPIVWTLHDFKLICPNTHFFIDKTHTICEACNKNSYYQAIAHKCKKNSILASIVITFEAYIHRILQIRKNINLFISPSKFLQQKFIQHGFQAEKIKCIPLFITKTHKPPKDFKQYFFSYFLFFGKINRFKGVSLIIDAAIKRPKYQFIFAGRLEDIAESDFLKLLPQNIKYVGILYDEKLSRLIRDSFAVIVPSIWYENQPFSILEAFGFSKPVIASNLGGISEIVQNQETGLLFSPGNLDELLKSMDWLKKFPQKYIKLCQNSFAHVKKFHNEDLHYSSIIKLYENFVINQ